MNLQDFFHELKKRNVFKVAGVYAVAGWILIQIAATTFPFLNIPNWGVRLVIALVLLGFPIAIILAWAFEMTPEGVKRTEEVPKEHSITKTTGKKLNNIFIIVLVLAVIVLSYKLFFTKQPGMEKTASIQTTTSDTLSAPAKSIAVLPFENLSTDSANAYFADGMQDMILTKLADIGDLKVISRTSTEQYKSHPDNLKTIANQLGVGTILEGSVQKAGKQVLINVQLINARSDDHIWAESYTRTLDNIFGVEGEVAQKIATALKARLDPAEQAQVAAVPTHNPAAYDAYLRGLSLEVNSFRGFIKADSDYARAVKLDPDFALAWAHLSSTRSLIYSNTFDHTPEQLARAKQALDRAMALAPDAAATQIAAGNYYYHGLLDYNKALAAYRKALKISPNNAEAITDIGFVERRKGHWQTAIDNLKRSIALDPRNVTSIVNLGQSFLCLGNYTAAEELFRQALAINPTDSITTFGLATTYSTAGDQAQANKIFTESVKNPAFLAIWAGFNRRYSDAIRLMHKALAQKGLSKQAQGNDYYALGSFEQFAGHHDASRQDYERAISTFKKVDHWSDNPAVLSDLSQAQAGLGEKDAAITTAKRAIALYPTSRDAFSGPYYELNLVKVQAWVGEKTQAMASLKRLLAMPPGSVITPPLSPSRLRLSPTWDPLRKEPGFQALLSKYGSQDRETGVGG